MSNLKVSDVDKILLATHTIAFMSARLNALTMGLAFSKQKAITRAIDRNQEKLADIALQVTVMAKDITEFMNSIDAVDEIDNVLFEPVFRALNDAIKIDEEVDEEQNQQQP